MISLLCSCTPESKRVTELSLKFDASGNYIGFKEIPSNYSASQAYRDSCLVIFESGEIPDKYEIYAGKENWQNFYDMTEKNQDTKIRVAQYYKDTTYFEDIFYIDEKFHYFNSKNNELTDVTYNYILKLSSVYHGFEEIDVKYVLTNDNKLTYDEVIDSLKNEDSNKRFL